jgi:hypothetical protein
MNEILHAILFTPGVPLMIGGMIATAMLIGFIIYDNTPSIFVKVVASFVIFLIFVEWIRITIIGDVASPSHPNTMVMAISIIVGALFIAGLVAGMLFAKRYRKKIKLTEEAAHDVIEKIRNGDYGSSRINQPTKPLDNNK